MNRLQIAFDIDTKVCRKILGKNYSKVYKDIRALKLSIHDINDKNCGKEMFKLDFRKIDGQKSMSNGMRNMEKIPLDDDEIELVKKQIQRINADETKFVFNDPDHITNSTCYNYAEDVVYVTKNILPDKRFGSTHPRDIMSIACVLAHEYYGHRTYRNEYIADKKAGQPYKTTPAWQDECRASLTAAKNTPNLTEAERRDLVMEAIYRANEAGHYIENDDFMKEVLYGYANNDNERNISSPYGRINYISKESQDREDEKRYGLNKMSKMQSKDRGR